MKILGLLSHNLSHGSRTRRPDDPVPYPSGFRGTILHTPERCIACGICVYTCSPGAITIDNAEAKIVNWNYREDRCTFCGCCVQYCPTQALTFDDKAPLPLTERTQHYLSHEVILPSCRECGEPVRIISEMTLKQLYGNPLPEEIAEAKGLCEACRQKLVSKRFLKTIVFTGEKHDE